MPPDTAGKDARRYEKRVLTRGAQFTFESGISVEPEMRWAHDAAVRGSDGEKTIIANCWE